MSDSKSYVSEALRTAPSDTTDASLRAGERTTIDLLHGAMGAATEAGELVDGLKKHIFYGRPLDRVNLVEELGDLAWYIALMCGALNVSLDHVLTVNIDKLKVRYPEKFTEEFANNRDLAAELEILEGRPEVG